ncbi:MAG: hypothetical protein ACRELX_15175, partial [Longimicrobiales bacterium]
MKGIVVHAALLAVALIAAFVTWTAGDSQDNDETTVQVWDRDIAELAAVVYQSGDRTVEVERRDGDGEDGYLWATETMPDPTAAIATNAGDTTSVDSTHADTADDDATADTASADTSATDTTNASPPMRVEEFPVGDTGTRLFEELAQLRALRDLGEAD